jgi:hypothetical protein
MVRLSEDELAEMRRRATQGYAADFGGGIDDEREPDLMIQLKRSEIGDLQRWLLRAVEEIEGLSLPAYAIDDETAIKVVDGTGEVVSEGHWKLFTRSAVATESGY